MKKNIAMLGMMAAAMGMGAMPSATPNVLSAGQVQHQDALAKDLKEEESKIIQNIRRGPENPSGRRMGFPPKNYGQWLQNTGRQKWNRKA